MSIDLSSYRYPFGKEATKGRVDQGVDAGGSGPIGAVGRARILNVGRPAGWPGTGGILYQLLEGPYAGRHVYVYEGVKPSVRKGQIVNAGQVIGKIIPGTSTGIEMGWANAAGVPIAHSEYTEGKETRAGGQFAAFLLSIQAQRGELTGHTPIDKLTEGPQKGAEAVASAAGSVASSVLSGIFGEIHPEALMLNIGLIGGGAFLVYYGAALMLGIRKPVATPAKVAAVAPK